MDAMIMNGQDLRSGAVAAVQKIQNPIRLARLVMDRTPHCLLVGDGASAFADECGVPRVSVDELTTQEARQEFATFKAEYSAAVSTLFNGNKPDAITHAPTHQSGHDTVGAVAFDQNGNIACATSTGGITGKRVGRVGDTPLVGLGGYADNAAGACAATGHGESIMRTLLASRAIAAMERGADPSAAAREALENMQARVGGRGGLVCVDRTGRVGHWATTERMVWASVEGEKTDSDTVVREKSGIDVQH